jgi:hypothetical protein
MTVTVTNTEDFHITRVRELYVDDRLSLHKFERAIEHVLRGGYLDANLELRAPIMDRVRRLQFQRNCRHADLIDISDFDGHRYICAVCGKDSAPWLDDR